MSKRIRAIALALILVSYITLTYNFWWIAPVGSVLIILLSRLVWPRSGVEVVGLRMPFKQIGVSLFLFCIVLLGSFQIVRQVAVGKGVIFVPVYEDREWVLRVIHTVGQTLNEEMVLGALFLRFVQHRFRPKHPFIVSVSVAFVFSLLHYLFYGLRPPQLVNYGKLSTTTLVSLFSMGVVRNNCILTTGNIGYAWALHLGWNIAFMDSSFYSLRTHTKLPEPSVFNLILGSGYLVGITSVLMVLSFLLCAKREPLEASAGQ